MSSENDVLFRTRNRSNLWELELLEPRVLLSAQPGISAALGLTIQMATRQGLTPSINSPPSSAFTPSQINSAYGFNQILFGSVAGSGSGQTVAIIDPYDDPTALNDINAFSQQFNLPLMNQPGGPTFTKVGQTGGAVPRTDPNGPAGVSGVISWEVAESFDIEWVHAIAPQANIILVEASSLSGADMIQAAVGWAASQPGVVAVSISGGGVEFSGQTDYDSYFTTPSGHAGVTFLDSTQTSPNSAGYPATSPNVVAVGGTRLTLSGSTYQSEIGSSDSGGGISAYESQPFYQSGVVAQSATMRTIPDVSMAGDYNTWMAVYDSYDFPSAPWVQAGGPATACPLWAGLIAIVDQGRSLAGLGSLDGATGTLPALYSLPGTDFHDITTGNNGYAAGPGYDLVTGLGTPVADKLIPDLVAVGTGSPSKLAFRGEPTSTAAGATIAPDTGVQVVIEDQFGGVINDASSVTLTLSSGTFASGASTVTVAAVNGVANFNDLIINAPGNYTLTASDGTLTADASQSFNIFGTAAKLGFTQQPTNTTTGVAMTPAVTVAVLDGSGDTVLTNHSQVILTLSSGTFAGGSRTTLARAVNGIATFSNLIINASGNYTLTASDAALAVATSQSFIVLGPSAKLGFAQQPANTVAGTVISPAVTVEIEDASGNTVATGNSSVKLTLSGGTFAGGGTTATVAAVNGVATFNNLIINVTGNYTLIASDGTLFGATSGSFAISAAAAAKLAFTQQPSNGTVGRAFSPAMVLLVQDLYGNTVVADNSTVTLTLNSGTFADGSTTATVAAVNGVATFNNLIINTLGSYTLTASDGALMGATSGSFTICPLGDANLDGVVNATDIDQLYAHLGDATGRYDLNGDGIVNQGDVDYLVKTILQTGYADANLDRKIDFTDFQVLLDQWQLKAQGWAGGDWNGDGVTDFQDFQVLLDNWNPNGFGTTQQSVATSTSPAAVSVAAMVQVASTAVASPSADPSAATAAAVLTGAAIAPAPLDNSINLLSPETKPSRTAGLDSGRSAIRHLRQWTVCAPSDGADTVDLLTHLRSKPVVA